MEQNITDILQNQFNKLSKPLQTFIISDDFIDNLKSLGKDYNLDGKKQTVLENETMMIFLGLESFADLEENLIQNAQLTQEQALGVAKDVLKKIITPVGEDLRVFLEREIQEEEERDISNIEKEEGMDTEEIRTVTQTKEVAHTVGEAKALIQEVPLKKEGTDTDTEEIKKLLRENSKTVNIKNLIANLK